MDKLKPIIEQKFWIFLGLALLLPFIGWFLARSSYATGVEDREKFIKDTFDKLAFSGDIYNQKWVDGADVIVKDEQRDLVSAQRELWNSQKQGMAWPNFVQSLMENVPYEGEIPVRALEFYSQGYFRQLGEIEERLRPFNYETGEGVLLFDGYLTGNSYTHVPVGQWNVQPPTSTEMWNAQIDTWLVNAVFESIESINQGAEKITEAPVRQLLELTLRGGERDFSEGGESAASGDGGEGTTMDDDMYSDMGSEGSSGAGGGASSANVKFDLSEELGPAGNEQYGGGITTGSSLEDSFGDTDTTGGDSESEADSGSDRYVDDDDSYPFRTRAFVLGVVMDHRVLPEFMAELSRSDWPIQIIRVQTAAMNLDTLPEVGRSGVRGGRRMSTMRPDGFGSGGDGSDEESMLAGSSGSSFRPSSRLGTGRGTSQLGARNAAGLVQQAQSDPYLAEVWIGGLITLFRPVADEEIGEGQDAQSPGIDPGTTPPAATQETPGDGVETTVPADAFSTPETDATAVPDSESSTAPAGTGSETDNPETSPGTESATDTNN